MVGAVVQGHYKYMQDLASLDKCRPVVAMEWPKEIQSKLNMVVTPLRVEKWAEALAQHPDREFVGYLLRGIQFGFRIGCDRSLVCLKSATRNMRSAAEEAAVVESYLEKEVAGGRIVGPVPQEVVNKVHISRFGVIPKPHQPGKWRLIVDLSHPKGASVNDGVVGDFCSLTYTSVDTAAELVLNKGKGAELAKLDIQSAYRMVAVHPDDRPLLGVKWKGEVFVDTRLPFGLRSAPKVFTALADGLEWILREQEECDVIHYLDDFLLVGAPKSGSCGRAVHTAVQTCAALGVPLAMEKLEGPADHLTFLGIVVDSGRMELRLPEDKLQRILALVSQWQQRKSCTKRELLSLIGYLQHAARMVRQGRPFLRRMIDLSSSVTELHHHIRLRGGFKSDLQWWAMFTRRWNGISVMSSLGRVPPSSTVTSDASGRWGCGAFLDSGKWFQCEWKGAWAEVHITAKELLPIVLASALWGREWTGRTVLCRCDNAAVVAIIRSGRSKHPLCMHLLRCLSLFTAAHEITIIARHLPGSENGAADALSRGNLDLFFQQVPTAEKQPTVIPEALLGVLVHSQPDWTSPVWRRQYASIL